MDCKYYIGIDIGSTASKVVIIDDEKLLDSFCMPTGWNSKETAQTIMQKLIQKGFNEDMTCAATGYGRICVDYAAKNITEITCHGKGGLCTVWSGRYCYRYRRTGYKDYYA